MSVFLTIILGAIGAGAGIYASSKKRMRKTDGKQDWTLWGAFLTLFTVGIVLGIFSFPAEALALSFTSIGALVASKASKAFDPRIRNLLVSRTSGVVQAYFLGETKEERERRLEIMSLARKREKTVLRILKGSMVDGAASLRSKLDSWVNHELPRLFVRTVQIRKAITRTKEILVREKLYPSSGSNRRLQRLELELKHFEEEEQEIKDGIRNYSRALDVMAARAERLRIDADDVDPERIERIITDAEQEFKEISRIQTELAEAENGQGATRPRPTLVIRNGE